MYTWVASSSWLLWIMPFRTQVCKYLFQTCTQKCTVDHMAILHLVSLRHHHTVFDKWLYHFTFPPIVHKGSNVSLPYLLFSASCSPFPNQTQSLEHSRQAVYHWAIPLALFSDLSIEAILMVVTWLVHVPHISLKKHNSPVTVVAF